MIPPIFSLIASNPLVTILLGTTPTRFFPWGKAPRDIVKPYAVYQVISGIPENNLSSSADIDCISIQIDIYGESAADALGVAKNLRTVIESQATLTSYRDEGIDSDTNLYRWRLDVDFWVNT